MQPLARYLGVSVGFVSHLEAGRKQLPLRRLLPPPLGQGPPAPPAAPLPPAAEPGPGGGGPGDPKNAFTAAGRTPAQEDVHAYVRKLANYRKTHPVLQTGQLTHFVPEDGVYTYFRHDQQGHSVLVVLNSNPVAKTVPLKRFAERLQGYTSARDVLTEAVVPDLQTATVPAYTALVWELR